MRHEEAERFRQRFRAAVAEGERQAEEEWRRKHDPFRLGALAVMIRRIPQLTHGLTQTPRIAAANICRDIADELEHRRN